MFCVLTNTFSVVSGRRPGVWPPWFTVGAHWLSVKNNLTNGESQSERESRWTLPVSPSLHNHHIPSVERNAQGAPSDQFPVCFSQVSFSLRVEPDLCHTPGNLPRWKCDCIYRAVSRMLSICSFMKPSTLRVMAAYWWSCASSFYKHGTLVEEHILLPLFCFATT